MIEVRSERRLIRWSSNCPPDWAKGREPNSSRMVKSRRVASRLKFAAQRQDASVEDMDQRTPRGRDRSVMANLADGAWIKLVFTEVSSMKNQAPWKTLSIQQKLEPL